MTQGSFSIQELRTQFPTATKALTDRQCRRLIASDERLSVVEDVEAELRAWRPERCGVLRGSSCTCSLPRVVVEDYDYVSVTRTSCVQAALVQRGVPTRLAGVTLASFELDRPDRRTAFAAVKALAAGEVPGLLFAGSVGTGKTLLATACLRAAADANPNQDDDGVLPPPVAFVNVAKALEARRRAFDTDDGGCAGRAWDVARRERLVVLDDLGAEKPTEWAVEQIFTLVNARYESRLPVIVTTNLGLKDLAGKIGDRIVDRLRPMTRVVPLGGDSRRVPGAGTIVGAAFELAWELGPRVPSLAASQRPSLYPDYEDVFGPDEDD